MIFQFELMKSLLANGERTAIETDTKRISYTQLKASADRVSGFLLKLKQGLTDNAVIGIQTRNRVELIIAMIGVINARCTFVLIDATLPHSRLTRMIRDLNLKNVLRSSLEIQQNQLFDEHAVKTFFLEEILDEDKRDIDSRCAYPEYQEHDSLYIYFTSGSTGVPKGIVGSNRSLLQFLRWEIAEFDVNMESRVSQFISPYFDAFLRDVFAPLLAGGTVCVPPDVADFFTPEKLRSWIDDKRITLIHCVPSVFRIINNEHVTSAHFQALKYILLSGERIVPSELRQWYGVFNTRIQLVNLYGATESTMIRSYYRIQPEDVGCAKISIGKPIADTSFLVTDASMAPSPVLMPGDLYIISDYITKGYLNAPEMTHEKFLKIKLNGVNQVAFKTGDKARVLADGSIDLIGRDDRQVKLRGVRVELEEVENVLAASGLVKGAVVLKHVAANGDEYLIAFVIRRDAAFSDIEIESKAQAYLTEQLPAYMIPSRLIVISEFPLLSNGKTDYNALLKYIPTAIIVAPGDAVEEKLLSIWTEILGPKPISTEESFHSIGGNSLSIMRLIGRIYKEYGVRISLHELFSNLTIKKQAGLIHAAKKDNSYAISKAPFKAGYNLTATQERIYFKYELNRSSTAFNLPMAWKIPDALDKDRVEQLLKQLIERHESLRTQFSFVQGRLLQVVEDHTDFSVEIYSEVDDTIDTIIHRFVRPFDLGKAPLIRCGIIDTLDDRNILLLDLHHIICDGISQMNLYSDFIALFQGRTLKPLPLQYKDYAEWEYNFRTTSGYIAHREFWLKAFEGGLPTLQWPMLHMYDMKTSAVGGNYAFEISQVQMNPMVSWCKEEGVTTFSMLFSLYFMFLSQLTGQDDLVVGINTSGRLQTEVEGVVGMFTKSLPIRLRADMTMSFRRFVKEVNNYLIQANTRQIYDLADMVSALNSADASHDRELFDTMLVFQNFEEHSSEVEALFTTVSIDSSATSKYPLSLFVTERADAFQFRFEYASNYFTKADIELLVDRLRTLVERTGVDPEAPVAQVAGDPPSSYVNEENISFNF